MINDKSDREIDLPQGQATERMRAILLFGGGENEETLEERSRADGDLPAGRAHGQRVNLPAWNG